MTEEDHADGNAGGQVLSEVEGQAWPVERGGDLPVVHGAELAHGEAPRKKRGPKPNPEKELKKQERELRKSDALFLKKLRAQMVRHKQDALDALVSLAKMDIIENGPLMQVKLTAAMRLLGDVTEDGAVTNATSTMLEDLNKAFHQHAPRIREVRERIITIDNGIEPLRIVN